MSKKIKVTLPQNIYEIIKNDINVEKGSFFRIGKKELSFKISSGIFVNGKSLKITY